MSNYVKAMQRFEHPFELYDFQQEVVNELGHLQSAGYYMDVGVGKTCTSTVSVLSQMAQGDTTHCIVLMPPILIDGWAKYLNKIVDKKTGANLNVLPYRGTIKERKALPLGETQFTLMSYEIFRNDQEYILRKMRRHKLAVIADEATPLKNTSNKTHRIFRTFTVGAKRLLLTATPISNPVDGYAFVKFNAPTVYKSLNQFYRVHVEERDFFNNIIAWRNLDVLEENLKINSVRIIADDVLKELPKAIPIPIPYRLSNEHLKLYQKLAEEQLILLSDGGKIDATQSTALYNALQQIVVNFGHFADNDKKRSTSFDLIDETLNEIGNEKLVIAANYKMTNRLLMKYLEPYNARTVYGGNTAKQNQDAVEDFKNEPSVRVLIIQPRSGGYGIDGLQHVCNNILFIEAPTVPRDFHQLVGRLRRNGQTKQVNVRVAYAVDTIQVHLHQRLLEKDEMINSIIRGPEDLRRALHGK